MEGSTGCVKGQKPRSSPDGKGERVLSRLLALGNAVGLPCYGTMLTDAINKVTWPGGHNPLFHYACQETHSLTPSGKHKVAFFFFFFFVWIYSPRGLHPIMYSIYLYATTKAPLPFLHSRIASCFLWGTPWALTPHRIQLGISPTVFQHILVEWGCHTHIACLILVCHILALLMLHAWLLEVRAWPWLYFTWRLGVFSVMSWLHI